MDIAFLGTGSGYPTPNRGASGIALRYEGDVWLVDCGEGTQTQIMKLKVVRPGNITKIFITHLHGDHMFGLPGLLCTISMAFNPIECDEDLCESTSGLNTIEIFGPLGLRRFLREALNLSRSVLAFKYVVHELIPVQSQYGGKKTDDMDWNVWNPEHMAKGSLHPSELDFGRAIFQDKVLKQWPICQTNNISVSAGMLKHRIPSFGFVFTESSKPGKLDSNKLIKFGVPKGPLFGKIKNGEQVQLPDGKIVDPTLFIGLPQPGRKVAILQDTCDSWAMQAMCHQCDILIHEATNENMHQEKCVANGHSTPSMTAQFASAVEARMLILTHVSQRYKDSKLHDLSEGDATTETLTREAQTMFDGPVFTAYDGLIVNVKRRNLEP